MCGWLSIFNISSCVNLAFLVSIKLTHSKRYTSISYMYMYLHMPYLFMPYLFSGLICSSNFPFCYSIYFCLLLCINRFFPISDVDNLKMCLNYTFSSPSSVRWGAKKLIVITMKETWLTAFLFQAKSKLT